MLRKINHLRMAGADAGQPGASGRAHKAAQSQVVRGDAEQWLRGRARDPETPHQHRRLVRHLRPGRQLGLRRGDSSSSKFNSFCDSVLAFSCRCTLEQLTPVHVCMAAAW